MALWSPVAVAACSIDGTKRGAVGRYIASPSFGSHLRAVCPAGLGHAVQFLSRHLVVFSL